MSILLNSPSILRDKNIKKFNHANLLIKNSNSTTVNSSSHVISHKPLSSNFSSNLDFPSHLTLSASVAPFSSSSSPSSTHLKNSKNLVKPLPAFKTNKSFINKTLISMPSNSNFSNSSSIAHHPSSHHPTSKLDNQKSDPIPTSKNTSVVLTTKPEKTSKSKKLQQKLLTTQNSAKNLFASYSVSSNNSQQSNQNNKNKHFRHHSISSSVSNQTIKTNNYDNISLNSNNSNSDSFKSSYSYTQLIKSNPKSNSKSKNDGGGQVGSTPLLSKQPSKSPKLALKQQTSVKNQTFFNNTSLNASHTFATNNKTNSISIAKMNLNKNNLSKNLSHNPCNNNHKQSNNIQTVSQNNNNTSSTKISDEDEASTLKNSSVHLLSNQNTHLSLKQVNSYNSNQQENMKCVRSISDPPNNKQDAFNSKLSSKGTYNNLSMQQQQQPHNQPQHQSTYNHTPYHKPQNLDNHFVQIPNKYDQVLAKRKKWPLKGWHRRYFVFYKGVLEYGRNKQTVTTGRLHGRIELHTCIMIVKHKKRIISMDSGKTVYHLKATDDKIFRECVIAVRQHIEYARYKKRQTLHKENLMIQNRIINQSNSHNFGILGNNNNHHTHLNNHNMHHHSNSFSTANFYNNQHQLSGNMPSSNFRHPHSVNFSGTQSFNHAGLQVNTSGSMNQGPDNDHTPNSTGKNDNENLNIENMNIEEIISNSLNRIGVDFKRKSFL